MIQINTMENFETLVLLIIPSPQPDNLVEEALARPGFHVCQCRDGENPRQSLTGRHPDLIVVEDLPECQGFKIAADLLQQYPAVP
jgi:DNA-binding response OmpR family regulator